MWRSGILFLTATCYSFRTAMSFGFVARKKMLRVLDAVEDGIRSINEISEKSQLPLRKLEAPLNVLEGRGHLVSGVLMPGEVKIYRITSKGREALASRVIS